MDVDNIIRLFSLNSPVSIDIKNTSHGDDDFRETFIVNFGIEKIVIKLSANGFTDEKHLTVWKRIAKAYRNIVLSLSEHLTAHFLLFCIKTGIV